MPLVRSIKASGQSREEVVEISAKEYDRICGFCILPNGIGKKVGEEYLVQCHSNECTP